MKATKRWIGILLAGTAVGGGQQLWGQHGGSVSMGPDSVSSPTLEARVDQLDQEIRILQRLRELAADSVSAAAKDRQLATANAKEGFSLSRRTGSIPSGSEATSRATGASSPAVTPSRPWTTCSFGALGPSSRQWLAGTSNSG